MEEGNQVHSGYLLSPADLCLLSEIPRLVNLGVASLKIEGRMKRPEYVAVVTRVFRRAIDRLLEYRANGKADEWKPTLQETRELHSIFNRTFTSNQWSGKNLNVLSVDRPDNRGVLVGQVVKTYPRDSMVDIRLDCELHTGDGIEIRTRQGTNPATIVENIYGNGRRLETAEPGDIINIEVRGKCRAGDSVYRTRDRVLIDEARQTIVENREESKVPISVQVKARIGKSMQLSFSDPQGHKGIAYTETAVMAARNRPLTETDIIDKLDRLGNTPWKPVSWDLDLDPGIMIPFSELNEARRAAGDKLKDQILDAAKPPSISREVFSSRVNQIIKEHGTSQALEDSKDTGKGLQNQTVRLSIRVPSVQTARAALESEVDRVYLSLLGIKGAACTGEEIKELQDIANGGDKELFLEVPAILRPGEKFDFTRIRDLNPDGILVGNPGALRQMHRWGIDIQADYTFNTFNSMTVEVLAQYGVKGVCLSPELNRTQLKRLVTLSMPLEYIVHGQLQVMISEHCIAGNLGFCSRDCHQTNRVLKDDKGYEFPLATDRYCRLHVFNSRTTCLIEQLGELSRMGIKYFRIESLLDNVDQVKQTIYAYRQAIHVIEGREKVKLSCLRKELEAIAQSPLTSLHLKRGIQ
jgi:putative protease